MNNTLFAYVKELPESAYVVCLFEHGIPEKEYQVALFYDKGVVEEFVRRWNKEEGFKADVANNLAALNKPPIR